MSPEIPAKGSSIAIKVSLTAPPNIGVDYGESQSATALKMALEASSANP
jgi:hypothetical protein